MTVTGGDSIKPYVRNNGTNEVERAVARRLSENDVEAVLRLQRETAEQLEDPGIFVVNTREEFLKLLAHGELHGLFAGGRLVAAAGFYFPGDTAENHGRDVGLDGEALLRSAVLDTCFVAPLYRGNGIARELVLTCLRRAVCEYGALYVLATVSPKNAASLLSLMSVNGMRVVALRQKYGCRLRYILRYEHRSKRLYTVYERYPLPDVYNISRALAGGFEGIATFKNQEGAFIWLAK